MRERYAKMQILIIVIIITLSLEIYIAKANVNMFSSSNNIVHDYHTTHISHGVETNKVSKRKLFPLLTKKNIVCFGYAERECNKKKYEYLYVLECLKLRYMECMMGHKHKTSLLTKDKFTCYVFAEQECKKKKYRSISILTCLKLRYIECMKLIPR